MDKFWKIVAVAVAVVVVVVVESQEHRPLVLWDRTAGPIPSHYGKVGFASRDESSLSNQQLLLRLCIIYFELIIGELVSIISMVSISGKELALHFSILIAWYCYAFMYFNLLLLLGI